MSTAEWFVCVELHIRSQPVVGVGPALTAPGPAQLERARERGLRTAVLVSDRQFYGNRFDHLVDLWITCATRSIDAVCEALTTIPGTVRAVTSSVDSFAGVAADAAAQLGLIGPTPGSPALARDKASARQAMAAAGIPDVAWAVHDLRSGTWSADVPFPCVVKPVDGAASWDVGLAQDELEVGRLLQACRRRMSYGRGVVPKGRVLAEEYISGPLFSAEGFVDTGGRAQTFAWSGRRMTAPPDFAELAITCTTTAPCAEAASFVQTTLTALGYDFGAYHLEFILSDEGLRLVELNPRLIGSGAHACVDLVAGVDTAAYVVDALLGQPSPQPRRWSAGAAVQQYLAAAAPGVLRGVRGIEELAGRPGLVAAEVSVGVGARVKPVQSSSDYLGHVVFTAATVDEALRRADDAAASVDVLIKRDAALDDAEVPLPQVAGSHLHVGTGTIS